ncbi:transmembrane amino acid transporter [Colletotrichum abscissum]|uniref:Transmembrane amino acid transporter n=3 Tax=Colletotrichum acutatum species complex TaxID=2707335 RepID=A0A9Q0B2X9_9PEZI|nr:transmembrane amino acid transporter [Colletotrichum costaricense]XP_060397719.1 transmembrane amino acid transporter [Colletotrichum abscissum]KAI3543600.1 transmembrane amino acid transporter [Colletotrichum filicis]KAK1461380.1 transmembrane amino acid transporter [Colletotrichum melonis]KAI3547499.1 transmembrane amino acid transporter [Colletotrichum abscissum]KAK1494888.1 transmembrane amino acid transporter [Colletotrichum abscissum]KAK1517203.1 transmembrane amino acid transporter 
MSQTNSEKSDAITPAPARSSGSIDAGKLENAEDAFEVFKRGEGTVDFRTVGWIHASVIFLKVIFATGVLTIPSAMFVLGALPGAINVLGWQFLNTYCAIIQGNFRNAHAGCHSIADMANVVGGVWLKEVVGVLFLVTYAIVGASGIFGTSVAFNALSNHAICTNYFMLVATACVFILASARKFEKIAWLTWAGFLSVYIAVFIVVVAVTQVDRPAAAPKTGDFDLGYHVIGNPNFVTAITSVATIFCSGAGTSAFLPVISEMKKPKDYNKAVYLCMGIVTASYLTFSLVVYRWCGQWVASPSLGSAGETVKKVSYGIGLIGLMVSACLYIHVAAKYLFVRILRDSVHLQKNSVIHWSVWLACTLGMSVVSFLLASGIPIFNYLLALAGSLTFAPLALGLPGYLWIFDHPHYRQGNWWQAMVYWLNWLMILLAVFLTIGGTYGVVQNIIDAYADGLIGGAFSCVDNSGSS